MSFPGFQWILVFEWQGISLPHISCWFLSWYAEEHWLRFPSCPRRELQLVAMTPCSHFQFETWLLRGERSVRDREEFLILRLFFFKSLLLFLVLQNSILIFASTETYGVYRKNHWYVSAIVSLERWQTLVCEPNLIQVLISSSSERKKNVILKVPGQLCSPKTRCVK